MVNELIQLAVLVRELLIDATIAAVLYFVADRLAVAPTLAARIRHPLTPLTKTSELDEDVVNYCNEETEDFAKEDCLLRGRNFHLSGMTWPVVLTTLQREDGVIK